MTFENRLYASSFYHIRKQEKEVNLSYSVFGEKSDVSVNSNWVHPPPGNPRENFFERANPGQNFLSNFLPPGQKMMVEFPGVGQNFPKLEETAP